MPFSERSLIETLSGAGCVAPEEEAEELLLASGGDLLALEGLVGRRVAGEPLAWVTGSTTFAGQRIVVYPGVYVPRWQSEILVKMAIDLLPQSGVMVDLCTGSGAIAAAVARTRTDVTILGTETDPVAFECALANGVDVRAGYLGDPLPASLYGATDLITCVAPYVPTAAIEYLPRDFREWEPWSALDGGEDGCSVLRNVVRASASLLRQGGSLLIELGFEQDILLREDLEKAGFQVISRLEDDEGDIRGLALRRPQPN